MTPMVAQITSLTVVYSTVYSDVNQRRHQSSASLAFVWGSHRDRWIPRTKGQLRGKCFHVMTSSSLLITTNMKNTLNGGPEVVRLYCNTFGIQNRAFLLNWQKICLVLELNGNYKWLNSFFFILSERLLHTMCLPFISNHFPKTNEYFVENIAVTSWFWLLLNR